MLVANDTYRIASMTVEEQFTQEGVVVQSTLEYDFEYDSSVEIDLERTLNDRGQCFE